MWYMTTPVLSVPVVEGPLDSGRYGSVGFRLGDPHAPALCRMAARTMIERFRLAWVDALTHDVQTIVTELVTNAQRYGGNTFPAGSFTIWHPGRTLHITVHDKNPVQPWEALYQYASATAESGRGLQIVKGLAEARCGRVDFHADEDENVPGKVVHVTLLMPDVVWPFRSYRCPWTGEDMDT